MTILFVIISAFLFVTFTVVCRAAWFVCEPHAAHRFKPIFLFNSGCRGANPYEVSDKNIIAHSIQRDGAQAVCGKQRTIGRTTATALFHLKVHE